MTGTTQPDLFEAAAAGRQAGQDQSQATSGSEWNDYAFAFVAAHAAHHHEFYVDDLWDAGLVEPESPRALGAVMLRASRAGLIEKTGEWKPSVRSHLGPKPVWRSLTPFLGA